MSNVTSAGGPTGGAEQTVAVQHGAFVRKSSGLVRAFSPVDTLIYNILAINPWVLSALTFTVVVTAYPGASPWLAALITGAFCCFEAVVYAFLMSTMPRSGGDYVFQSRVIGGGAATFFNLSGIVIAEMISILTVGVVGTQIIFSPFLTLFGLYYHAGWLSDFGTWLGGNTGTFVLAVVCAVWMTVINVLGLRLYARLQRYAFILGMVGVVIVLLVMLFTSRSDFVGNFNSFMSQYAGVDNAYNTVISRAGHIDTAFSLNSTIVAIPLIALGFIFPAWGALQAGEIKRANTVRWNMFSILGAEVFSALLTAVSVALLISRAGGDFFVAAGTISGSAHDPLPVGPFFSFFATIMGGSVTMAWLLFITANCWFWMWFPNLTLGLTRSAVAMSFDGVLPRWVGDVSPRWHTPIKACLAALAGYILFALLFLIGIKLTTILAGVGLMSILTFTATMIAGALLPYVRPRLFESAPAAVRSRIGGVPIITVAATVFTVFGVWFIYRCLTDSTLGISQASVLIPVAVMYVVAAAVYIIPASMRRRRGDLSASLRYKELPIE